jgi:hypothetical protein
MQRVINLVGTHCVDGDHAALRRWYADHVHMLMAFPDLLGATLYALHSETSAPGLQYLCLYEFASAQAFEAYEGSALRAAVEQDRQRGWGRDGIRILMRAPYRLLYRRMPGSIAAPPQHWRFDALRSGPPHAEADERALAATVEFDSGFMLLRSLSSPSPVADTLMLTRPPPATEATAVGNAQKHALTPAWSAEGEALAHWAR